MVIFCIFQPRSRSGGTWGLLGMHQSCHLESTSIGCKETCINLEIWESTARAGNSVHLVWLSPSDLHTRVNKFCNGAFYRFQAGYLLEWGFINFEKSLTPNRRGERDWRALNA